MLSKARSKFRWGKQFKLSLNTGKIRTFDDETSPENARMAYFCSMCGPGFSRRKQYKEVRGYAAKHGLGDTNEAIAKSVEEKTKEYVKHGGEVYTKA